MAGTATALKRLLDKVDNETILDEGDMVEVIDLMDKVAASYSRIGLCLRLPSSDLDIISADHSKSVKDCLEHVLKAWLNLNYDFEKHGMPTWRKLAEAAFKTSAGNNGALAKAIADAHPVQSPNNDDDSSPPGQNNGDDSYSPGPNNGDDSSPPGPNNGDDSSLPGPNNGDDSYPPGPNNGDDSSPPCPNNGDDSSPPTPNNGEDSSPPGPNNGDDSSPPGPNNGDDSYPPGPNNGDDSSPPGPNNGENSSPPGPNNGEDSYHPSPSNGDGSYPPGPNNGDDSYPPGPNNGEDSSPPGPNNGDNSYPPGPNNGDDSSPPGPNNGDDSSPPGPNNGDDSSPPGPNNGDDSSPPGPNNGDNSSPPGPNNGEDSYPPGPNNGDDSYPPGPNNGDDSSHPSTSNGDGSYHQGPNNGEDSYPPGPNNGDDSSPPGPNNGEDSSHPTPSNGEDSSHPTPNNGENSSPPDQSNGANVSRPSATGNPFSSFKKLFSKDTRTAKKPAVKPSKFLIEPSKSYKPFPPEKKYETIRLACCVEVKPVKGEKNVSGVVGKYDMDKFPHGIAVIVNVCHDRKGTEVDEEMLINTLRYLGYIVEVYMDPKATDMCKILEHIQTRDHSQYDSFVCCILSHGADSDKIYGSDDEYNPLDSLANRLIATKCPSLNGKPKMFFIEASRGSKTTKEFIRPYDPKSTAGATPHPTQPSSITVYGGQPSIADFIFSFATSPGYVAYREMLNGSWYTQELCAVLCKHSTYMPLGDMLKLVNNNVGEKHGNRQAPLFSDNSVKNVFFF